MLLINSFQRHTKEKKNAHLFLVDSDPDLKSCQFVIIDSNWRNRDMFRCSETKVFKNFFRI